MNEFDKIIQELRNSNDYKNEILKKFVDELETTYYRSLTDEDIETAIKNGIADLEDLTVNINSKINDYIDYIQNFDIRYSIDFEKNTEIAFELLKERLATVCFNYFKNVTSDKMKLLIDCDYNFDLVATSCSSQEEEKELLTKYFSLFDMDTLKNYIEMVYKYPKSKFIEYMPNELLSKLDIQYIKKISVSEISKEKFTELVNLVGLKTILEYKNNSGYHRTYAENSIYEKIIDIKEDELLYILENNLYHGIEKCTGAMKNRKFVKKLIELGYSNIIYGIEPEMVDDEIFELLKSKVLDKLTIRNLSRNLSSKKIKSKRILDALRDIRPDIVIKSCPIDYIDDTLILDCMLNGIIFSRFDYTFGYVEKLDERFIKLLEPTYENFLLAMNKNIKIRHLNERLINEDVIEYLLENKKINNNQINEIIRFSNNLKIITLALKYKVIIDLDIISNLPDDYVINNFSELDYLFYGFISTKLIDKYSNVDFSKINFGEKNEIYHQFIKFNNILSSHNYCENYFFRMLNYTYDIEKYFDENGPKVELFNIALFNEKIFKIFGYYDYKKICNYPPNIEKYIEFTKIHGLIFKNYINSLESINEYFKDGKIGKKIYDISLFDNKLFYKFFLSNDYKEVCNYSPSIEKYIEFTKVNPFILSKFIKNIDDINEYFKDGIISKKLYDVILFDSNLFSKFFNNEDYKKICNYSPSIEKYIEFTRKYGFILNGFVNSLESIDEYFKNGKISKKLYDKALFNNNLFSILFVDDSYKSICNYPPSIEKYIEFVKQNGISNLINSLELVEEYFKDGNISKKLYDEALFNIIYFKRFFYNDDYKNICNYSPNVERYIEYAKKYGVSSHIHSLEDIEKVFNNLDILFKFDILNNVDRYDFLYNNFSNIMNLTNITDENILLGFNVSKEFYKKLLVKNNIYNDDIIEEIYQVNSSLSSEQKKLFSSKNIINNFERFNIFKVVKYNLKSNLLNSFFEVFASESKVELLSRLYEVLKNESSDRLGDGTRFLLHLASSVNSKPMLFYDILVKLLKEKNDYDIYNALRLIYGEINVNSIEEFNKLRTEKFEIDNALNNEQISQIELKDLILKNIIGMDYETYKIFLERHMDLDTINKIKIKIQTKLNMLYKSETKDLEYINYLESNLIQLMMLERLLSSLLSTINSTNDVGMLKKSLRNISENNYMSLKKYSINLMDKVRQIYELDAQLTLTKISDVQNEIRNNEKTKSIVLKSCVIDGIEYEYYDFSKFEYTLYAHSDRNVDSLFNSNFVGHSFLCVTPVSDRGVKGFYSGDILYGYDNIPNGGFIACASTNTGSNFAFSSNNIELKTTSLNTRYDQKEIKQSSSLNLYGLREHSETNLVRDGLYPSCIMIRGEEPTIREIEAAKNLAIYLGLPEGSVAPMVKLQPQNTRVPESELEYFDFSIYAHMDDKIVDRSVEYSEINLSEDLVAYYDYLKKMVLELSVYKSAYGVNLDKVREFQNIKLRTGASHNIYKCNIKGKDYYVKPALDGTVPAPHRAFAVKLGSEMQKLINPSNSIDVKVMDVNIDSKDVLCSLLEDKKNTCDFDIVDNSNGQNIPILNDSQIESFLRELIVDHLIFNYDTKGVNFLYDSEHIYGIDKEQALKFCTDSSKGGKYINPTRQSGNGVAMYNIFLQHYKDKISKENIIRIYSDVLNRIENVSLLNYFKMYENYLMSINLTNDKVSSIIGRRIRLVEEVKNFVKNYFDIDLVYDGKDISQELDELNDYLEQHGLERVGVQIGNRK